MNQQNEKARVFIDRLLANPSLKALTPLQREEQIVQFLKQNAAQLLPTLTSGQFFPDMTWEQVLIILCQVLMEESDKELLPRVVRLLYDNMNLTFIFRLQDKSLPEGQLKKAVEELLPEMLSHADARRDFTGVYNAVAFNLFEKYVEKIYERRQYAYIELAKVQRLDLTKEEVTSLIKTAMFLRPAIYLLAPPGSLLKNEQTGGSVQLQYVGKVHTALQQRLPSIPEMVIKTALSSNASFIDDPALPATARISGIFALMYRSFRPNMKTDRGADTHDKSWLNIARRNYKYYGFDIKMLDELYKIAADNGW